MRHVFSGARRGLARVTVALLTATLAWPATSSAQGPTAEEAKEVWITLASADVEALQKSSVEDDWAASLQTFESHNGVTLALIREDQIDALSHAMHGRFRRCGGFMAHESREAALDVLYFDPSMAPQPDIVYTIDNAATVNTLLAQLSATNILSTINTLSANTNRYYTSTGGVNAANQLKTQWEGYAAGKSYVSVAHYVHPTWAQRSVIATVTGVSLPNEVIVIGGHLDSTAPGMPTGTAPGSDDDASGVATLTEVFRAAMATGYRPQRTVKFMAYAAEEVGLKGSAEIAANHQSTGVNVVGVLQLDMTLRKGSTSDIYMITDYTNAAQNTFVQNLIDTYVGVTRGTTACGYACSDHASWHNRGYVASFPFEATFAGANPYIHTVNDTVANSGGNANHAFKFAKLTAAYMAELAKGGTGGDITPPTTSITSPAQGASVSGTITVTADASDNVGVTKVEFYVDGVLNGTDTTAPYSFSWNTTTVPNGSRALTTKAYDAAGNIGTSPTRTVTVNNTGPQDLFAVYDATRKAPICSTVGKSCDSGASLLLGRDGKGPEPNQPNTINNSCADGTSGTYHVDESNDRIKVLTTDGTAFAAGKTVRIEATVWAYSSYTSDKLDLYRAPNASSPVWTFVATLTPTKAGSQVLSATYTLPTGTLQAVRARFRYSGAASSCSTGTYDDHDDLIFAVQ